MSPRLEATSGPIIAPVTMVRDLRATERGHDPALMVLGATGRIVQSVTTRLAALVVKTMDIVVKQHTLAQTTRGPLALELTDTAPKLAPGRARELMLAPLMVTVATTETERDSTALGLMDMALVKGWRLMVFNGASGSVHFIFCLD
jgi:hypothetical protein